jgi:hypothetical protein
VPVLMMHVRHMRMPVPRPDVAVRVHMRLTGRVFRKMLVLVVCVVHMSVGVLHLLVLVLVLMVLGQV